MEANGEEPVADPGLNMEQSVLENFLKLMSSSRWNFPVSQRISACEIVPEFAAPSLHFFYNTCRAACWKCSFPLLISKLLEGRGCDCFTPVHITSHLLRLRTCRASRERYPAISWSWKTQYQEKEDKWHAKVCVKNKHHMYSPSNWY